MKSYIKGFFQPHHPEKYKGNVHNIVYRSGWERTFMIWLDKREDVLEWSSEEIFVRYRNPVNNRPRRYFPDFLVTKKNRDGKIETVLIEIKPDKETRPPDKPEKPNRYYYTKVATYAINMRKWEAADAWAKERGYTFKILTENDINFK
jgi:hypothetical protein